MAIIEESTDAPVVAKTPQQEMTDAIEAINQEYSSSIEELSSAQENVQLLESGIFKLFISVSKKNISSDSSALDLSGVNYNDTFISLVEAKDIAYTKLTSSFKLLQKLRIAQTNYLVGVINSLQADAKKAEESTKA